jgi:hypothetical protein
MSQRVDVQIPPLVIDVGNIGHSKVPFQPLHQPPWHPLEQAFRWSRLAALLPPGPEFLDKLTQERQRFDLPVLGVRCLDRE